MAEIYDYEAGFDNPGDKNAWFAEAIGRGKRILEVGCATGYVGEHLVNQLDCTVFGIEYVPAAAEKARNRGCYELVVTGDIQNPRSVESIPHGQIDFVLFGDVLEHLTHPQLALTNVMPLLNDQGRILICVPSIVHWSIRWKVLRGQFEYTDTGPLDRTHVHFFTPKTIRDLVASVDLEIVRHGGVVWLPGFCRRLGAARVRKMERLAARVVPNLAYGQVLLDVKPSDLASRTSTASNRVQVYR